MYIKGVCHKMRSPTNILAGMLKYISMGVDPPMIVLTVNVNVRFHSLGYPTKNMFKKMITLLMGLRHISMLLRSWCKEEEEEEEEEETPFLCHNCLKKHNSTC